jgi:hypothetical protein
VAVKICTSLLPLPNERSMRLPLGLRLGEGRLGLPERPGGDSPFDISADKAQESMKSHESVAKLADGAHVREGGSIGHDASLSGCRRLNAWPVGGPDVKPI